jgi:hypothetical protein
MRLKDGRLGHVQTIVEKMIEGLTADLETALLRALRAAWTQLNEGHLRSRLQPPAIALSDGESKLGQWIAESRTIEIQRKLVLTQPWGVVVEVLKHEIAHQYVEEVLGQPDATAHGKVFQEVCEKLGFDARAAGMPVAREDADDESTRLLGRVAKLLALAESPNQHEAELAMAEAQRLMLKHNLSAVGSQRYGFRHLGTPTGRVGEHERILAGILGDHFFVECIWVPVWRPLDGKRGSVLEACGTVTNLALAEHTHAFLLHTAERLWEKYKRERGIDANRDRRAYLAGVMTGFSEKLDAQRKRSAREGLVWAGDGDLHRWYRKRHPHIRWTRHGGSERNEAHGHGREAGRNIVLHRAMQSEARNRGRLLRS